MNVYSLDPKKVINKTAATSWVRAQALASQYASEVDYREKTYIEIDKDIDEITGLNTKDSIASKLVTTPGYPSLEDKDLPEVVTGCVVAVLDDEIGSNCKKFFDLYYRLDTTVTIGKVTYYTFIGISNSAKTQTNAPFENAYLFSAVKMNTKNSTI